MKGTGDFFEPIGFRPGRSSAATADATELVSGLLIALGCFTAVGYALRLSVMVVAIATVHWGQGLLTRETR